MKWFIVTALVISATLAAAKSTDTSPIKKASSVKPTKNPKSILESFSGLSSDDTKFIKELDKQFKEHGDKIKIKVENDKTAKNPKRTIDGDLGYGYHQNQNSGFFFSQPKFMVYPYSQEDIPPLRYQTQQQPRPQSHRHTITKTHVQIQPSQGYEIKEEPAQYYPAGNQQQYQQQQPPQQQQQYQLPNYHYQQQQPQGPVIVLRIPGPAKYATHLQALLQQYLEIRAAQYIEALQEQEAAGQPHNVQSTVPQQVATPEYQAPMYLPNNQGSTTSLRNTGPHQYPTSPQPTPFKVTPSHIFHQQQQQLQQQQHQQQIEQQQQIQQQQHHQQHIQQSQQVYPSPAIYEEHQVEVSPAPQYQDSEVQVQVQGEVEYQQQPEQYAQQQAYEAAQQQQQQQQHQQIEHEQIEHQHQEQPQGGYQYEVPEHTGLQTNENFPSQHHTQVIFRKNIHQQQQEQQQHQQQQQQQQHEQQIQEHQQIQEQQPQIVYEQQVQPEQQYYEEPAAAAPQYHQQSHFYQPHEVEFTASSHAAVSITPKAPFGFHPHEVESTSASPSKRAAPFSEQQFKKFNKLITKLKKKSAELKAARGE